MAEQSSNARGTKRSAGASKSSGGKKASAGKSSSRSGSAAAKTAASRRPSPSQVAARAAEQLLALTGREAEGVTGLRKHDDGWTVEVEVVEVRRIPDTTDVLATYEVQVDEKGDLEGYRRLSRHVRGAPGEDQ